MIKKSIAWIVDSTAYISEDLRNHPDVYFVPLNIHFGEKQFLDGQDLTTDELYAKIREAEQIPKTSQPSAGSFAELFDKLSEHYEQGVAVHISGKLSGTLSSAKTGAELSNFPVTFIDSYALSYGITGIIQKGIELHERATPVEEIVRQLQTMAGTGRNYILIGKLDQLFKGGRMSSIQFYLGSLLNIKPIVQISSDGNLRAIDKVRSEKKAMNYLVNKVLECLQPYKQKIYIMHGNAADKAETLKQMVTAKIAHLEVEIGDIGSVLAVHGGEGTLGIYWFEEH